MISLCPQAISGHITFKGAIFEINNAIGINIDPVCFHIRGIPISCLNAVRPLQYSKVSITYKANIAADQNLTLTLAGTHAETKVLRQRDTPAPILVGASATAQRIKLLGQTATELIEVAQPRTKILGSFNYAWDKVNFGVRTSYFGNVKAFSTGLSGQDSDVACDANNRCVQTFRGKTLVDLTLNYAFTEQFALTVGANNVFDVYPDKWKNRRDGDVGQAASYSDGQTPYTRNANQFGFNGAYYFVTASVKF